MEEEVSFCSPRFGYPLNPVAWMNAQYIARRVPQLMREIPISVGTSDKVFSSEWLSETTLLIGTKCNKLLGVDITTGHKFEVPNLTQCPVTACQTLSCPAASCKTLTCPTVACRTPSCGIHSIRSSPSMEYLATGGHAPNYLALYTLPDLIPLSVGEAHTDWIFAIQWLSNNLLITGSRDSSMALWSVPTHCSDEDCPKKENHPGHNQLPVLAERVPLMKPIFHFSNSSTEPYVLSSEIDHVRGLAYNEHKYEMASLQANSDKAAVHFWDVFLFEQISQVSLPHHSENVCIQVDSYGTMLYAVGSRSNVTFLDPREARSSSIWSVSSLDPNCGVRSLAFNQQLLSVGTGAGHLYFYDVRARDWLLDKSNKEPCTLAASDRWMQGYQPLHDEMSPPPNAIFTHSYSPLKTKIFTGGGPLFRTMYGNYATVWI